MLGNHRHIIALAPGLQLLYRCRSKGVTGSQHDAVPLLLEAVRQLANGRGFSSTIHAHNQNHERVMGLNAEGRLLIGQQLGERLLQGRHDRLLCRQLAAAQSQAE